jgi:hypothetical protein
LFFKRASCLPHIALAKGLITSDAETIFRIAAARGALPQNLGAEIFGGKAGGESLAVGAPCIDLLRAGHFWICTANSSRDATRRSSASPCRAGASAALEYPRQLGRLAEQRGAS